jgi:hypothetical protein
MWTIYMDYCTNSVEGSLILPTALMGFAFSMVHSNYHEAQDEVTLCDANETQMLAGIGAYASMLFKFGQFCYANGILVANMTEVLSPDSPDEGLFTDEALRKFMGNA